MDEVQSIQSLLFSMGAQLASKSKEQKRPFPEVSTADIKALETHIDEYEELLPRMTHFILPGGNKGAAHAHIARCVCRRADSIVVPLSRMDFVDDNVLVYLNRLSDYLSCLAMAFSIWAGKEAIQLISSM